MKLSIAAVALGASVACVAAAPASQASPSNMEPNVPGDCTAEQSYSTGTIRWFHVPRAGAQPKIHVQRRQDDDEGGTHPEEPDWNMPGNGDQDSSSEHMDTQKREASSSDAPSNGRLTAGEREVARVGLGAARKTAQSFGPPGYPISKVIDEVDKKTKNHERDLEGQDDRPDSDDYGVGAEVSVGRLRGGVNVGTGRKKKAGEKRGRGKWGGREKRGGKKKQKKPQKTPGEDGFVEKASEKAAEEVAEKAAEEAVEREYEQAEG